MKRFSEWMSMKLAKRPGAIVLGAIFVFNILFFFLAVFVLKTMNLKGTEGYGFFEAAYLTITMILDAGCISYVIEDIGRAGVATAIVCLVIIFIGMISFTGAVIGYITNYISNFMEKSNQGYRRLKASGHIVILNWNSRASEIINDQLYRKDNQKVVVLVSDGKERIEKEINERLSETITVNRINKKLGKPYDRLCKVDVVVREGDVFSKKQLMDISLHQAQTVIILGNDINNTVCKYESRDRVQSREKGNAQTIKTLIQVADITGAEWSASKQKIIVEITDEWTDSLVREIIQAKQVNGKCNIVPVRVNVVLGQLLSQFSITPELNHIYDELFSNRGATFYCKETKEKDENAFNAEYLKTHRHAIPLSIMETSQGRRAFFSTTSQASIDRSCAPVAVQKTVDLNEHYWLEKRHVIILGHNSKSKYIMAGFAAFVEEWKYENSQEKILDIVVVDDEKSLEKLNYYKEYSDFVVKTVPADIYNKEVVCAAIEEFVSQNQEDTSVLILSDDDALNEDIDANAIANLIYVQDIVTKKKEENKDFDVESIDVIVELIDPKHHEVVNNYSGYNVVISNRYISKMITQIGEKDELFEFYQDMLSFDDDENQDKDKTDRTNDGKSYKSKEIYAKKAVEYFDELPEEMTAAELIRAVYAASCAPDVDNPAIPIGYVSRNEKQTSPEDGPAKTKLVLFEGDQMDTRVHLRKGDKLIVYSAH